MYPRFNKAVSGGKTCPRSGRLKNKMPLHLVMFTGRSKINCVVYSTLPYRLRGASCMSWIMLFKGSSGSNSPYATPDIFMYSPASPNFLAPSYTSVLVISILVIFAKEYSKQNNKAKRDNKQGFVGCI